MLQFEIDLNKYLNDIYKETNLSDKVYNTELPLNFDFSNNIGIYFAVNSVDDGSYKNVFSIDIHFYSTDINKINLLKIIEIFDKNLNKKNISNYWITHKNVYCISLKEEDLYHSILSYNVNKY